MFRLDERLQTDTIALGDFTLCRLLLMNDANYPWFILVPRRERVREIFDLVSADREQLWQETIELSEQLAGALAATKMNVAILGNQVSQLHVHVIARYRNDPAWPAPVWGKRAPRPYKDEQIQKLREILKGLLGREFSWIQTVLKTR